MVTKYYKEHPAVSTRKEMLDEVPIFKPAVNQVYPEKLAKGTMPPDLRSSRSHERPGAS